MGESGDWARRPRRCNGRPRLDEVEPGATRLPATLRRDADDHCDPGYDGEEGEADLDRADPRPPGVDVVAIHEERSQIQ